MRAITASAAVGALLAAAACSGCSSSTSARWRCSSSRRSSRIDQFTNEPTTELTTDNLEQGVHDPAVLSQVVRERRRGRGGHAALLRARPADGVLHRQGRQAVARRALIVAALLPLWAGYLVKAYAWRAMLRAGVGVRRRQRRRVPQERVRLDARLRLDGRDPHADLPLAAVHDAADLRRARPAAAVAARRLRRPRRPPGAHVPVGHRAAARAGDRRRLDLHVLAVARRLHHRQDRAAARSS